MLPAPTPRHFLIIIDFVKGIVARLLFANLLVLLPSDGHNDNDLVKRQMRRIKNSCTIPSRRIFIFGVRLQHLERMYDVNDINFEEIR